MAIAVLNDGHGTCALPQFEEAMDLFNPHLPCDASKLRKVYLRLALRYHPDKSPDKNRVMATQLFQAIGAAYEEVLKSLLGIDEDVGVRVRVKSPVAAAAELGDTEELRRLLEEDSGRSTESDDLGVFPLMFAAAGGCVESAALLVEFRADVHSRSPINWSVLLYAALADHADMIKWLVQQGARVGDHELWLTAYTGNSESLASLLELYEGSIPAVRTNESKKTLLHLAVEGICFLKRSAEKHAECVMLLLDWKVEVDALEPSRGRTCLQNYLDDIRWRTRSFEASRCHLSVVEELCMRSASVTVEDKEGKNAMSIAAAQGLTEVRKLLLMFS